MSLAARKQSLLALIAADRDARCTEVIAAARRQADALIAQARAEARQRLHAALAEERARARSQVASAMAELQTRRRRHAQRHTETLLTQAWPLLAAALRARWADADARATWVRHALTLAHSQLPVAAWTLRHAAGWPAAEQQALSAALRASGQAEPVFIADEGIEAGLRVEAGANVLDLTLHGLLADREEIGGRLVGLIEELK